MSELSKAIYALRNRLHKSRLTWEVRVDPEDLHAVLVAAEAHLAETHRSTRISIDREIETVR